MNNSPLVDKVIYAHPNNYTRGRSGRKIEIIAIHHFAFKGSIEDCGNIFLDENRKGSSHYGIGNDGRIGLYVDEENTAWANSNWDANCKAVSIETSNSVVGGDWLVGDLALKSLIRLVADIAKRNDLGTLVKGKNVVWHSMYTATTCPGAYLLSKLDYIIAEANKINEVESNDINTYTVKKGDSLWGIAQAVLGNGARYHEIALLNNIKNNLIHPGDVLMIPGKDNEKGDTDEVTLGCKVRVKNEAKTYTGGNLASFVYNRNHDVEEIDGDRVVITFGGIVVCAININDLDVVE